jgi:hypothetical protein
MNPAISDWAITPTFNQYCISKLGIKAANIPAEIQGEIRNKYDEYVKNIKSKDLDEAYRAFIKLGVKINPALSELTDEKVKDFKPVLE